MQTVALRMHRNCSKDEKENGESKNASENPVTGDGIACAVALFTAASLGIAAMPISNKKK